MKHILVLAVAFCLILLPAAAVHAQSGGTFELGGTAGQPDAAAPSGGTFELQGGFWNPTSAAPLAVTLASFSTSPSSTPTLSR